MSDNPKNQHFAHLEQLIEAAVSKKFGAANDLRNIGEAMLESLTHGVAEVIESIEGETRTNLNPEALDAMAASVRELIGKIKGAFELHIREVARLEAELAVP